MIQLPLLRRRTALAAIAAIISAAALAPTPAWACDVTYTADGNTAAIQRAIDAPGRRPPVVCLRPGHYQGARLIASRSAEVRAVGVGRVILDAGGRGRSITALDGGVRLVLRGLTLTEGSVDDGGAVAVEGASTVRLEDCWLTRNKASGHGGAVFVRGGGRVELVRTRVSANTASVGSALWVEGGATIWLAAALIHDNKSRGGPDDAALVVRPGSAAELRSSTLAYNPGHGVLVAPAGPEGKAATLRIESSVIMGAPDAIAMTRAEAGAAWVSRSVLYGRTGFVPIDPSSRRELPVFDLEGAERYRPTYGSPAVGIGRCDHLDVRRDVAGQGRPRERCAAGALEAPAEVVRKTLAARTQAEQSEQQAFDRKEPDFWPE